MIAAKTIEMAFFKLKENKVSNLLFSAGRVVNAFADDKINGHPCQIDARSHVNDSFCLHYEAEKVDRAVHYKCILSLKDAELHLEPSVFGQLTLCFKRINSIYSSYAKEMSSTHSKFDNGASEFFDRNAKGLDNPSCVQFGAYDLSNFPLDSFPSDRLLFPTLLDTSEGSLFCSGPGQNRKSNQGDGRTNIDALIFTKECDILSIVLSGIQLHIHDSSSVIATFTIPHSNSSVVIQNNDVDMVFAIDSLSISSGWWTSAFQENLWGPVTPCVSPMLNLRVRTCEFGHVSKTDICIGIQNVSAVLPPELLAVLIGYFTLSEWNGGSNEETVELDPDRTEIQCFFTYTVEIVDSVLIVPVESSENRLLNLQIPVLYCRFISQLHLADPLEKVPSECSVAIDKVAESNHSLNLFGRDLSLSYLILGDPISGSSLLEELRWPTKVSLIFPFSADVWILIPNQDTNESACDSGCDNLCVMARVLETKTLVEGTLYIISESSNVVFLSVDDSVLVSLQVQPPWKGLVSLLM